MTVDARFPSQLRTNISESDSVQIDRLAAVFEVSRAHVIRRAISFYLDSPDVRPYLEAAKRGERARGFAP